MRRLRILGVALLLAGVTATAEGQEAPVSTFQAFEGRTDSYAAGLSTKQISAAPVPVEMFLTRTRTEVNSQPRAQAYAGIVDVPLGELASMFGFPGQLPNYCYAQYPGEPDNQCGGGTGTTHAEGDGFNLDATAAESAVAAAAHSDDQLKIGASQSRSASRIVDGILQTSTEVVLQQVDIGGALAFEQMRSVARAATSGEPGGATAEAALTVSGVTIMGQRVPVPDELDLTTLTRDVLAPLSEALAAQGITVRVLAPPTTTVAEDGREAAGHVAGLFVESIEPATGNRIGISLGVARSSVVGLRPAQPDGEPEADAPGSPLPAPLPGLSDPGTPGGSEGDGGAPPDPAFGTDPASSSDPAYGAAPAPNSAIYPPGRFSFAAQSDAGSADPESAVPAPAESRSPGGAVAAPGPSPAGRSPTSSAPAPGTQSLALAGEVMGERVADRLPVLYGLAATGIVLLGLLGFRLAVGGRS